MIYLDTSFVVSLLAPDCNSASATMRMREVHEPLLFTNFARLEAVNALHLRRFRNEITAKQLASSMQLLEDLIAKKIFRFLFIQENAFRRGEEISRLFTLRLGIRSADLLHIAATLESDATSFYSFDITQRKVAKEVQLILNPIP